MVKADLEVLSARRLNRALLARQHLLERTNRSMVQVIEDIGGLQTQYAPSGYVSLWTRMTDFPRGSLTRALEQREVVKGTLQRSTIHTVSAGDYWATAVGIRASRQEWVRRVAGPQMAEVEPQRLADALREALADGPLRAKELTQALMDRGLQRQAAGFAGMWVDLVRIPPSGTWERRANDLYDLADRWLPPESQPGGLPSEEDGIRLLLRRYLAGFGPARINDFCSWAGITLDRARKAAATFETRRFRDEQGRELMDLPDAPLPDEDTPAPVRLVPVWEPMLLVNCRRTEVLPERYRPFVFNTRTPQSINTILVDGQVCGSWRYDLGAVVTETFTTLPAVTRREIALEAERLTVFYTD